MLTSEERTLVPPGIRQGSLSKQLPQQLPGDLEEAGCLPKGQPSLHPQGDTLAQGKTTPHSPALCALGHLLYLWGL